jgi:C-terminal processing protease CtpA/Prc
MPVKLVVIISLASFAAAFAAATWIYTADEAVEKPAVSVQSPSTFNAELPVEDRIRALEQAASDERFARQLLQEEVFYLTSELERLSGDSDFGQAEESRAEQTEEDSSDSRVSRREAYRRRNSPEGRMQALIDAGFLPSQASMIVQRESELQMEAIRARYEAERSGDPTDFFRSRNATSQVLREELGDADYERYLVANGRSTSITVSSVIESSPAQSAGLQPGDEIVRYDGERVFDLNDISRQAAQGEPGQNIVVDIMRNGAPMQMVLPRGPIGITGGRRR